MKRLRKLEYTNQIKPIVERIGYPYMMYDRQTGKVKFQEAANYILFSKKGDYLYGEDNEMLVFEYTGTVKSITDGKTYYSYNLKDNIHRMQIYTDTRYIGLVKYPYNHLVYIVEDEYDEEPFMDVFVHMYYAYVCGFREMPTSYNIDIEPHDTKLLDANGIEYVDLGLSSGTLWATKNLGANSITDIGDYYSWGETETKDSYGSEYYTFYSGVLKRYVIPDTGMVLYSDSFTKYNTTYYLDGFDGKTRLEPEDDAAHLNMGGDWHMPSAANIEELLYETEHHWVDDYEKTGVSGTLFTSLVDKDKSIFFPCTGYMDGRGIEIEDWVVMLSSEVDIDDSRHVYILNCDKRDEHLGWIYRTNGGTVRGVLY